jgi:hypothetical protein
MGEAGSTYDESSVRVFELTCAAVRGISCHQRAQHELVLGVRGVLLVECGGDEGSVFNQPPRLTPWIEVPAGVQGRDVGSGPGVVVEGSGGVVPPKVLLYVKVVPLKAVTVDPSPPETTVDPFPPPHPPPEDVPDDPPSRGRTTNQYTGTPTPADTARIPTPIPSHDQTFF